MMSSIDGVDFSKWRDEVLTQLQKTYEVDSTFIWHKIEEFVKVVGYELSLLNRKDIYNM